MQAYVDIHLITAAHGMKGKLKKTIGIVYAQFTVCWPSKAKLLKCVTVCLKERARLRAHVANLAGAQECLMLYNLA